MRYKIFLGLGVLMFCSSCFAYWGFGNHPSCVKVTVRNTSNGTFGGWAYPNHLFFKLGEQNKCNQNTRCGSSKLCTSWQTLSGGDNTVVYATPGTPVYFEATGYHVTHSFTVPTIGIAEITYACHTSGGNNIGCTASKGCDTGVIPGYSDVCVSA